jgi:hypothetical protein
MSMTGTIHSWPLLCAFVKEQTLEELEACISLMLKSVGLRSVKLKEGSS